MILNLYHSYLFQKTEFDISCKLSHMKGQSLLSGRNKKTFKLSHYENTPIQIYRKFHHQKLKKIG